MWLTQPPVRWVEAFYPGDAECEPPCSAKVTNKWWRTCAPQYALMVWTGTAFTKKRDQHHTHTHTYMWGRDSSVGIATRYGLDGPGIESR